MFLIVMYSDWYEYWRRFLAQSFDGTRKGHHFEAIQGKYAIYCYCLV